MKCEGCGKIEGEEKRPRWAFIRFENRNVLLCEHCAYQPIGTLLVKLDIDQEVPASIASSPAKDVIVCASCDEVYQLGLRYEILPVNSEIAVAAAGEVRVTIRPQIELRILRLILDHESAETFDIQNVMVGRKIVIPADAGGNVPGMAFDRSKVGESPSLFERVQPGQDIWINAVNRTCYAKKLRGFFICKPAVYQ